MIGALCLVICGGWFVFIRDDARVLKDVEAAEPRAGASGLHKIKHVIIVMQENRSFDSYFGTYPGADGIRFVNGHPAACVPNAGGKKCVWPFHDFKNIDTGGPHSAYAAKADINGGQMNGFIRAASQAKNTSWCLIHPAVPVCATTAHPGPDAPGVVGYHTAREIPNYWTYAHNYVLQDHMFEPNLGWSMPSHLFTVSAWSAHCSRPTVAASCRTYLGNGTPGYYRAKAPNFAWTDITYLLHRQGVVGATSSSRDQPDCIDGVPRPASVRRTPTTWCLESAAGVHRRQRDDQLGEHPADGRVPRRRSLGHTPAVSWVIRRGRLEHPPRPRPPASDSITELVNAVMHSPDWSSTAIFVAWDDWGGFYDHVVPTPRSTRTATASAFPAW